MILADTTFEQLKALGLEQFGDVGAWAYDEWRSLNRAFFEGRNHPGAIAWQAADAGESLGSYAAAENVIYLFKGLVRPRYPTPMAEWCLTHLNRRLASDVLLHEMMHQKIQQTGGWQGADCHVNARFVAEVNRIAPLIGLEVFARVSASGVDASRRPPGDGQSLNYRELAHFPYFSRPYNYYYEGL